MSDNKASGNVAIPEAALGRLEAEQRTGGNWSSDLSVAELAAIHHAGFVPLDFVMGSSIYHVGAQWGNNVWGSSTGWAKNYPCLWGGYGAEHQTGFNWEHTQFQNGFHECYRHAITRLVSEAQAVGAHGVVGVRVNLGHVEGVGGVVEFTAYGTAIRRAGSPLLDRPFTSHLTGQQFAKLLETGVVPTSMVYAVCAVEVDQGCSVEHLETSFSTNEIDQLTEAVWFARSNAVSRLEEVSVSLGEGVVGVDVNFSMHELGGRRHLVQMWALGTAVHQFHSKTLPKAPLAIMRLS